MLLEQGGQDEKGHEEAEKSPDGNSRNREISEKIEVAKNLVGEIRSAIGGILANDELERAFVADRFEDINGGLNGLAEFAENGLPGSHAKLRDRIRGKLDSHLPEGYSWDPKIVDEVTVIYGKYIEYALGNPAHFYLENGKIRVIASLLADKDRKWAIEELASETGLGVGVLKGSIGDVNLILARSGYSFPRVDEKRFGLRSY